MKFEWEKIYHDMSGSTWRAKVYKGWLVRVLDVTSDNSEYAVQSVVFVPDEFHKWELK